MDDTDLTRKAIEELMREMGEQTAAQVRPQERKVNPLGSRPNKRFLGRTLNSVMQHNQRESVRTQASSREKLREMDDRDRRRAQNSYFNGSNSHRWDKEKQQKTRSRTSSRSRSSSSSSSSSSSRRSSSSSSSDANRKRHKKKRKKHKKRSSNSKHRRKYKDSEWEQPPAEEDEHYEASAADVNYADNTMAQVYYMQSVALAYNQMQAVLQQQQQMPAGAAASVSTKVEPKTEQAETDRLSDLSITDSITHELALTEGESSDSSTHSSTAPGEILTFDVSSSGSGDENEISVAAAAMRKKSKDKPSQSSKNTSAPISCISLDSDDDDEDEKEHAANNATQPPDTVKNIVDNINIEILSSSSEHEEELVDAKIEEVVKVQTKEQTVDLTED